MKNYLEQWNNYKIEKHFIFSSLGSMCFLIISLIINYIAGTYATESASLPVTDIILSNTNARDVDGMFIYGTIILLFAIFFVLLRYPKTIPFTLKSISLFVVIRSIFISLTHLGLFPNQMIMHTGNFLNKFIFGGDLFFSGHTGLPFLIALIFWNNKKIRFIFLTGSIIFAVVVLLGHLHYSIDVMAAFFITYSIFKMSEFFFKKDRKFFFS